MGQQSRSRKPEKLGKGKVTPVQVAFIVDRYLSDNHFNETRSVFRSEASSLLAKSPVSEAPKSLLTLGTMLNEYISLKEQKVMVEQERVRLEQEKQRIHSLLQGMQNVMNTYNATASAPAPMIQPSAPAATQCPPSGYPAYGAPNVMSKSTPSSTGTASGGKIHLHSVCQPLTRKRTASDVSAGTASAPRKSRCKITGQNSKNEEVDKISGTDQPPSSSTVSTKNPAANEQPAQAPSAAKCLFNQASVSPPVNSSSPKTPPQTVSPQSEPCVSVRPVSSDARCQYNSTPKLITPTNCTIITKERVMISPMKHVGYYTVERSRCVSSSPAGKNSKRLVKGRLDFDGSDAPASSSQPIISEISTPTSQSEKEPDIFGMDFPNFDALAQDLSFSDLFVDLDLGFDTTSCQATPYDLGYASGSSPESRESNPVAEQFLSEYSSTVTEVISGKDISTEGADAVTAVKSTTKCIRIVSPAKK